MTLVEQDVECDTIFFERKKKSVCVHISVKRFGGKPNDIYNIYSHIHNIYIEEGLYSIITLCLTFFFFCKQSNKLQFCQAQ